LSLKIAVESHIAKALDASHAVQQTLDILVSNLTEAQKGSLSPRVMSPALLVEILRSSIPSFPADTTLPFPLGKDDLHLIYQFSDVCVYTYRKRLGYVISVPLVHKRTLTVLRMIPISVPVDQEHFLYIHVRDSVLCLDQNRQYYFTMQEGALAKCKLAEPGRYVCTHQRTLLSTVTTESGAVKLLHKRDSLPPVCDTRLIRLSNTVWTQLSNNSWIFYAPHPDVITILCYEHRHTDIHLKGIRKVQVYSGCKGYSSSTLLYGSSVVGNICMQVTGDFLSQIDLKNVCCEELGVKVNFCQTPVEVVYKNTITHLDDLRSTSTRVSDLLEKLNEQEWRNNHVIHRNTHSVSLILRVSIILIWLLFKLYTLTGRWMPTCLCRKEAPNTPIGVSHALGRDNQENIATSSNIRNENSPKVAKPTPAPPSKASQTCVATSLF